MSKRGQILIIIAFLIPVLLLFLAVAVDAGRLFIERSRMKRAAQGAADAGISIIAEQMVTQVVARQTIQASTPSPTPPAAMTAIPALGDLQAWLTNEDRATLVSPSIQIAAGAEARLLARANGFDIADSQTLAVDYKFPQDGFDPTDDDIKTLRFSVSIKRREVILLAGLLNESFVHLEVDGLSEIPHR